MKTILYLVSFSCCSRYSRCGLMYSVPKEKFFPALRKLSSPRGFPFSTSAQELRSFEIKKETGDSHVEDDSSPRGVLEDVLFSSELETSSQKDGVSFSQAQGIQNDRSHWRGFFRLWKQKSMMRRLYTFPHVGKSKISRGRSRKEGLPPHHDAYEYPDFCLFKPSWKSFTFPELRNATNNFSSDNVIGKGGYAEVYRGLLENGQLVAIKKLTKGSADERAGNFLSELGIIVHVNHPNTARLVGFGVDGGMHIVLELSPHGSLASLLHSSEEKMDWRIRYKVALGTAEGLHYLHSRCQRRIIHRDIKAANILLTENFEPQICDFGLAKWLPDKLSHITVSTFDGTFGYLAPEYLMHGIVDEKIDIYAFGVLLLELVTGHKAVDSSHQSLVVWAKSAFEEKNTKELVDPSLSDVFDEVQLSNVLRTASLCIQQSPLMRPRMHQVVKLLRGEDCSWPETRRATRQKPRLRTYSEDFHDQDDEYNTVFGDDDLIKKHRKLVFGF